MLADFIHCDLQGHEANPGPKLATSFLVDSRLSVREAGGRNCQSGCERGGLRLRVRGSKYAHNIVDVGVHRFASHHMIYQLFRTCTRVRS